MKFIQSLWTNPLIHDQATIERNILYYKVSSFLLKKYFPEIKLELVTDSLGAELLKEAVYDKIELYFDNKIIQDINPVFKTVPKLFALLKYDEDIIHFDGDFFPNSRDFMENFNFDVIAQNKEAEILFELVYSEAGLVYSIIHEKVPIENYAYNCGVLGFKNINFKNFYLKKAISLFYKISNKFNFINENLKHAQLSNRVIDQKRLQRSFEADTPSHRYLCCIIEQYSLAVAAAEKNIYVKEIIGLKDALRLRQIAFDNKKFLHPCGQAKDIPSFIKCLKLFYENIENNYKAGICDFFMNNTEFINNYNKDNYAKEVQLEEDITSKIIDWLKVGKS